MAQLETLIEVLGRARGSELLVLLTGHPDPDSIAAALAHRRICEHVGVRAHIAHVHPVSRLENRAMVKLLGVDLLRVRSAEDLEPFRFVSLVDTNSPDPTFALPEGVEILSVVDHHRGSPSKAAFQDIRLNVGATATIYAQYFENGPIAFGSGGREDALVATALLAGIRADTDDYVLATPDDFRAAAYLRPLSDANVLRRLGRRVIAAASMDVLARALADLVIVRDFALAGVGFVTSGNRDAIGEAADYILRREDIDTVLTFGIVDQQVDGSLRTVSASLDPASFMETAFGRDERGRPYGGGRADKGGFQFPLGLLAAGDGPALWSVVNGAVRNCVARVIPGVA
jgi:nanoRNase/pAp phosphatase (c-di-AMP/oligoRNAs hydrolase)